MKNLSDTLWSLRGAVEAIDWDAVYGSELPRIFNYFLYKIGDRELAQDLAQEMELRGEAGDVGVAMRIWPDLEAATGQLKGDLAQFAEAP